MITGTTGDDLLNGTAADDEINSLGGSDIVNAGAGNDSVDGGDGDDFVRGEDGADTLVAGAGDDFLNGGPGDDQMDGGAGLDRVSYGNAPAGVTVNLALAGTPQTTGFGQDQLTGIEQVSGTAFADTLTGDAGANWLWSLGGADTLSGAGGDDLVSVGAGAVRADGGAGLDTLSFYSDTLTGPVVVSLAAQGAAQNTTQGSMTLSGFENLSGTAIGGDTLTGDSGNNVLAGWGGADSLTGGGGGDLLLGDGFVHVDSALGGSGPITTFVTFQDLGIPGAAEGADTLDGGAGDDDLRGGGGNDDLRGGDGADFLRGQAGSDTLSAGAGDDFLNGGAGDDAMDGGAGIDRASFGDAPGGVTVNLSLTTVQNTGFGQDTLVNIEQVSGTAFNDVLTGNGLSNWLWGLGGGDTLLGAGGDDLVSVGAGAVQADGGTGVDTLAFYSETLTGPVQVSLAAQGAPQNTTQGTMTLSNFENVSGNAVSGDNLGGDSNANVLAGWGGSDSLSGAAGDDTLLGDGFIHVDSPLGGAGPITTFETFASLGIAGAAAGNDTLDGGAGNDRLVGGDGADRLISGAGADTIDAGAGDDRVIAGAGSGEVTAITLGSGSDVLEIGGGFQGVARVVDFVAGPGGDAIDLAAYASAHLSGWNGTDNPFATGHLRLLQQGADTLVQADTNGGGDAFTTLARLEGVSSLDLTAANLGYAPQPTVSGDTTSDTFEWAPGSPATSVDGGAGSDLVTITAPTVTVGPSTIQPSPDGLSLLFDLDGDGVTDLTVRNVEDIVLNGERLIITGDLSNTGLSPNTIHYVGSAGDNLLDASGMTSVESIEAQGLGGADTLLGGLADDALQGGDGDDSIAGGGDTDTLTGGAGADRIDGGGGADIAVFSAGRSNYAISTLAGGEVQVVGPDGTDVLTTVERLRFADGTWAMNQAPTGADKALAVTAGSSRTIIASDFGFADGQGDSLLAVRVTTVPAGGALKLSGVTVSAGQVVPVADIAAGHLVFTPSGVGTVSFTFQVQDNGLTGWGAHEDATPNTISITASDAPPPAPPPAPQPVGTAGDDVVVLDATVRSFSAGAGNDNVTGSVADDLLRGEAGADTLNGGGGADTVEGGDGPGYLRGNEGNDVVAGGDSFDDAHGNMGDDTVSGGGGDDWVVGGKDQDLLSGDGGNDIVYGNLGDDTGNGGDGADTVRGGQGDDVLNGGAGADWLAGDRGSDTISGGQGADTFHTWAEAGMDRVLDFNASEGDRVNLLSGSRYSLAQVGADTVIDVDGGAQMVLVGVQLSSLPQGWIFGA
jgi:Ca2+-binding RTX toxin-like protein